MAVRIGTKIDQLYKLKEQIELANKDVAKAEIKVNKLKAKYASLEDSIFNSFDKQSLEGAAGKLAKSSINRSEVPTVKSWPKLYAHIKRTGEFDLLQKRPSTAACRERWNNKKSIAGVGKFVRVTLSLTKL